MSRRRLVLLLLCIVLALAIVHERSVADELDVPCPDICALGCAGEGGCLLFRQVGCRCSYVCESGVRGGTVCGGGE